VCARRRRGEHADVAAIGQFCAATGMRLTFFANGDNDSWTINAPLLRPMVASGQIQLGNHTWSHANLPPISHVLPQLAGIIAGRGLQAVTLNDVFF
jgi:peptidoglycan/xylan/chitin deacetylase (PgdA/CDA1 family)